MKKLEKKQPKEAKDFSTAPKELTKNQCPLWALVTNEAEQLYPSKSETHERLAYTMINYFYNTPDAFYLTDFFYAYGITEFTYRAWMAKSELLQRSHEIVLDCIYKKRLKEVRKVDVKILLRDLYLYSKEWQGIEKKELQAKKDEQTEQRPTTIIVKDLANKSIEEVS